MSARFLSIALATAAAAILVPAVGAFAKDDPAKVKSDREALLKDFKAAKKYVTSEFSYVVDVTKLKDQRWEFADIPPLVPAKGVIPVVMKATLSPNPSDPSASIEVLVYRAQQSDSVANTVSSYQFNAWGKSVKVSDVGDMAQGHWEEFMLTATEPSKEKSKAPQKVSIGPAKLWGYAVGTDKETKQRVKKDWFLWTSNDRLAGYTWWIEATTSQKLFMSANYKDWNERLENLVKGIVDLKDPRAHN
jgi:hypothetical protein